MDITELEQEASGNEAEWNVLAFFFADDKKQHPEALRKGVGRQGSEKRTA